ncbi:zinc finger protein 600-like [Plodia interpunctella]|uniref:zinc finger protein 600-like n=1 Tax=Plodia interpunctella TaxID=58824 RepID=UPI002368714F|nr:zinc finger protein 600-like [Plodia interpunctella]
MDDIQLTELETEGALEIVYKEMCRICLRPGEIPIFGDDDTPDISAEVITFGEVDISCEDQLPQHLCVFCHKLLQGAILFRNTAKESEMIIKSNDYLVEDKNLDVDGEDPKYEAKNSENCMSDYSSESGDLKIVDDYDTSDINTSFEQKRKGNETDIIMIVVSDEEMEINSRNQTKYSCESCKVNFQTSDDYCQHMTTIEHKENMKQIQNLECYICDKFIGKDYYVSHMTKHSFDPVQIAPDKYICRLCNKVLLSEQALKIHKECEVHNMSIKDAQTIECPVCHCSVSKIDLKLHIKTHIQTWLEHGQGNKEKCLICDKNFDSAYYNNHLKIIHNKESKNVLSQINRESKDKSRMTFICDKCGKVFHNPSNFKLHYQTHGGELKYKCMFCPYRGLQQGLLKIHIRTHTGDYNYECDQCQARFITKSNLDKHRRTHIGPIHFKCKTCNRGFYTKLSLERHNTVDHLGIKRHVCNICGKAFGYRNYMMCHQLKVHKRERLTKGKGRLPNYLVSDKNYVNKCC